MPLPEGSSPGCQTVTFAWTDGDYFAECHITRQSDEEFEVRLAVQGEDVSVRRFTNEIAAREEAERIRKSFLG